jgi:2-amino-4-hydroxy-6-hydroxymethyldihydropteridine diphosphokinase
MRRISTDLIRDNPSDPCHPCSIPEATMPTTAYIALGSNLGDRQDYLDRALQALQEHPGIVVTQVSGAHETEPVGGPPGQDRYLNAAAELQTDLSPAELLDVLLDVERQLERVRGERWGPRTIDLDLLLYGDLIHEDPRLTVPHPLMAQRAFVLAPLCEIAPDVMHPVRKRTVRELLDQLTPPTAITAEPPVVGDTAVMTALPSPASAPKPRLRSAGRELAGLRALVSGSTSGIGRAIALEFAAAGADVIVHGRRSQAAEEVRELVREAAVRCRALTADLRDPAECRRLVEDAWDEWDGLDIWVNNAGADTLTGESARWPFERKLDELLAMDVTATMLLARDVGARMKARGEGVILNVGWDQADTGMEGDSGQLFGATKAAVMAFSKSLALTLAPEVRVNCLAPGWIQTAWGEAASATWQQRVLRETPLRRWGTPEDVAAAARWLASPAANFITGQVVRVNGGAVR